ncbi:MAG: hypothetical protein HY895_08890 [Deltaproteobacteria bacterium]|nr:hypothetical protein [Deltaproteobacteria bacterium]
MSDDHVADDCADVASRIRDMLARGVSLPPEVLRFIDSTFFNPTAAELAAVAGDESASERDPLLELLFAPDEAFQVELEEMIAGRGLDEERVAGLLCRPPLKVLFRFPDARKTLGLEMTPPLARHFVSQLRIARPIPADLSQAIESAADAGDRQRARVLIRNARVQFTPETIAFLSAFLTQVGIRDGQAWECLRVALDVLSDGQNPAGLFQALADRKRWLVKALTRGRKQEALLGQANIETLMSQGARLTVIDEADTCRRIGCIDRICAAVFGRVPPPGPLWTGDDAVELTSETVVDAWRHSD